MIWVASLLLACATPQGLPCYTITVKREQVVLFYSGPGDLGKYEATETRAQGADGSFAVVSSFSSVGFQGQVRREQREFYDAQSGYRYWLAPSTKTWVRFKPHIPVFPLRPSRSDNNCRPLAMTRDESYSSTGTQQIQGWQTKGWRSAMPNGGSIEVWNAPGLDCTTLRSRTIHRNALRFPELTETVEPVKVESGEPDRSWFVVPEGYKEDDDPRHFGFGRRR
ncbi:MAG: hypothetical protein H7039_24555 [Bryobacteraceae bacterium]|nr:hypothetical protein [Bryobacteraceae bacterium]